MAVEYAEWLSHNINRSGVEHIDWTSEASGFESDRTYDNLRYTTWKATSTATQNLTMRAPNLIENSGFENGVSGWELETTGTATVTFARTTDEQNEGDASGEVDVTAYTSGSIYLNHRKTFCLKADRTYNFTAAFKNDNAAGDTFVLRIVDSAGASLASQTDLAVGTTWTSQRIDHTPSSDEDDVTLRVEFPESVRTNYLDSVWFNEVRAIDTLVIDQGHTLKNADGTVQYRIRPTQAWQEASAAAEVTTAGVYYRTFTGVEAFDWRLVIGDATAIPEIPSIHLGKRVTLSHNPVGFDPSAENAQARETTTEAGIVRDYFQFTRRLVSAQFENIGPTTEFQEWEDWWNDIDGGREHFWWIWRPTSRPKEILLLRLDDKTFSFPFDRFSRSGGFQAEEVRGQLESA